MGKIIQWIKNHLPTQRRLIQLYAALLYNAHTKGYITGNIYTGATKIVCVPGMNCYSCPGAVGACPLGSLQNAIASSKSRTPVYVLGILMLYGLILGRTICGYLCPVGLVQELLHKLPTPKIKKSRITYVLSFFKYVLFAVLVIAVPLWFAFKLLPLPAFCKFVCPAGTLGGAVGLLANPANTGLFSMLGGLFTWKMIVALLLIGLCVFLYRGFCRFLCPMGAFYGFFSKIALVGVKVNPEKCNGCGKCVRECQMDIRHVGDHECINCGKCISSCPTKAIELRAGKFTLRSAEKKTSRRYLPIIGWLLALGVLIGVAVYVNRPDPKPIATNTAPEIGSEVGKTAPDFTVPIYGGGEFTLSDHRGKIVIVNFWATWCTPCCKELPHFDSIYQEYSDDIMVIAIHGDPVTDDVPGYLSNFDYTMPFALDEGGKVGSLLGVSTTLPHTIIIDANGVITYNAVGSLNKAQLEALMAQAAESSNEIGNQVGMTAPDFTVPVYGGGEFTLSAQRGKVVVVNFWATWCTPCCKELPHFDSIYQAYPDDVMVIAIHGDPVTDDVPGYLSNFDYAMPFALDEGGKAGSLLGVSTTLPHTIIIDANGVITYNAVGSLTEEQLQVLVSQAMNKNN